MAVPNWVHQAVFYQIFPDRFNRAAKNNNFVNFQSWGARPTLHGFQGGDLEGIRQKLDYLSDFGINAIYLNPIFESPSTHRYNTTNYFRIDPKLGSTQDFQLLLADAHSAGIKIILDGVFNHCGRGFFAFNDLLENQQDSPYTNWFHVKQFPIDAFSPGDAEDYLGWWKFKSLPKFNTDTPGVKNYIFDVVKYWTDMGIDGWRLDVPNEIDDDEFWGNFRQIVKTSNPEAYLIGEIWDINPRWVGNSKFDGLMNYPFRTAIINLVNASITTKEFVTNIETVVSAYSEENLMAMFSLLGSHDTERIFTLLKKDVSRLKLAYLLLFTLPGVPSTYYGDEIGLEGGKDPDCRRAFNWNENSWNQDIHRWVKSLIAIRKENPALQKGVITKLVSSEGLFQMVRKNENDQVFICVNPSSEKKKYSPHGEGQTSGLKDLISGKFYSSKEGVYDIEIDPHSGVILAQK